MLPSDVMGTWSCYSADPCMLGGVNNGSKVFFSQAMDSYLRVGLLKKPIKWYVEGENLVFRLKKNAKTNLTGSIDGSKLVVMDEQGHLAYFRRS